MLRILALTALLSVLALAGCGESDDEPVASTTPTPEATAEPSPGSEEDPTAVREISEKYADAIATSDWDAACGLMSDEQQERTALDGDTNGDCPKALAKLIADSGIDQKALEGYEIQDVTIEGDTAVVTSNVEGAETHLLKQGDEWVVQQ